MSALARRHLHYSISDCGLRMSFTCFLLRRGHALKRHPRIWDYFRLLLRNAIDFRRCLEALRQYGRRPVLLI